MAVTRNEQTARQCHLYRGIFPILYNKPANDVWAEDVDLRVSFALELGKDTVPLDISLKELLSSLRIGGFHP